MIEADSLLMKRAIELARRGAGLVSPNPLVGAVLVNEGRVVGEGYHRYDRVRHAESYAIEQAGRLSRGATLYCNLEPCCHQGRTPPCAGALIEAGVSRVVVAMKDPNRRVNGLGLELLRGAGIDVETGLLEDRAVTLNEIYFKFTTTGIPFVHGVIDYAAGIGTSRSEWHPSDEFMRLASEYDAVLIGSGLELDRLVVEAAANRERHRSLVLVASGEHLDNLPERIVRKTSVIAFELEPSPPGTPANVVRFEEGVSQGAPRSALGPLLATLARMNATSVLALPGLLEIGDPSNFKELDKVTLAIAGSPSEQRITAQWAFGDIEFDLDEVTISEAKGFTEVTGYPSLREVA